MPHFADRITYAGKSLAPITISGGTGRDRLEVTGPHVTLDGGEGKDDLIARGTYGVTLNGGAGADRLFGGQGIDSFYGDLGDDSASLVHLAETYENIERISAVAGR